MKNDKWHKVIVEVPSELTKEEALLYLKNETYKIGCLFFESIGEYGGMLMGNGHHMAQSLSAHAEDIWNEHLKRTK